MSSLDAARLDRLGATDRESAPGARVKSVTIDAEGVVCRRDSMSDFGLLREAVGRKGSRAAFRYPSISSNSTPALASRALRRMEDQRSPDQTTTQWENAALSSQTTSMS
jgi:hypothetical protein